MYTALPAYLSMYLHEKDMGNIELPYIMLRAKLGRLTKELLHLMMTATDVNEHMHAYIHYISLHTSQGRRGTYPTLAYSPWDSSLGPNRSSPWPSKQEYTAPALHHNPSKPDFTYIPHHHHPLRCHQPSSSTYIHIDMLTCLMTSLSRAILASWMALVNFLN